jgi:hypothetical protein
MLSLRLSKSVSALPVGVSQLASTAGMRRPVSLRALLSASGTRTRRPRICLLRYQWETPKPPKPGVMYVPPWPDAFYEQVLSASNGWSLHDYWYRVTDGLIDLDIQIQGWNILPGDQAAPDSNDRGKLVAKVKDQARADGIDIGSYDHVVAFLYPGNNNAGARGTDAILDQSPFSLEFYQHEMGHVLGYSHAFGTADDCEYHDDWCVMGFSQHQQHPVPVPPDLAAVSVDNPVGFWNSGRRLSTAALIHYTGPTEFATTSSVHPLDVAGAPQTIELAAASESHLHDPTLAVIGTELFQLTLEYRMPTSDDAGIRPDEKTRAAVIVHSIGRRLPMPWQSQNVVPVWLEAEIPALPDQDAWVHHGWGSAPYDLHIQVLAITTGRVTVQITRADQP